MKPEQLLKFKSLFERERKTLIYTREIMHESYPFQQDDLPDSTDLAFNELDNSMRMRLMSRDLLYLKKIENALRRISEGSFGKCQKCSQDVELKRLLARPTTTYCVTCKEQQESKDHQYIDGHSRKNVGVKLRLASSF